MSLEIICSKSNIKHKKWYEDRMTGLDVILAIGGGTIIDKAKILGKKKNKEVWAVPTTGAGASETSHAVKWTKGGKESIYTGKPKSIMPRFNIDLPEKIYFGTIFDIKSHAQESMWSDGYKGKANQLALMAERILEIRDICKDNDIVMAGMLAGQAIEITGTNIIHAISYPITSRYDVKHGTALSMLYYPCQRYMTEKSAEFFENDIIYKYRGKIKKTWDLDWIATEALKYPKIHKTVRKWIPKKDIIKILKWGQE